MRLAFAQTLWAHLIKRLTSSHAESFTLWAVFGSWLIICPSRGGGKVTIKGVMDCETLPDRLSLLELVRKAKMDVIRGQVSCHCCSHWALSLVRFLNG